MNKIEKLKEVSSLEAQKLITRLVKNDKSKLFFGEKQKVKVESVEVGSFIKYAGLDWIVLDKAEVGVKVLSRFILYNRNFDCNSRNNWVISSLRKELNSFNSRGCCIAYENTMNIKIKDLIAIERDLMTDDGIADYGKCEDYISLITCDEYRKYRKLISNVGKYWWMATADSLAYNSLVRIVDTNGVLGYSVASRDDFGVRPLCILKFDTEVQLCEENM